jgi:molybdenum cofactor guanylyltransferase
VGEGLEKQGLRIGGIILAGGESRRFGSPKALARFRKRYFVEYAIDSLEELTNENVIISHSLIINELKSVTPLPVIEDLPVYKGKGPLAGLATGMKYLSSDWYVVLPCDTPNMNKSTMRSIMQYLKEDIDAVIPVTNGRIQPLIGVYHARVLSKIINLLESNQYKMIKLLDQINVKYISIADDRPFQNINNLEEYGKLDQ